MLDSKPRIRPPLCGFLICFFVSVLGIVFFVVGHERTIVVVIATVFLSGGVTASGLFLFWFFKTQRVYEKAESYVPEKFNIPEAKHLAMMSLDPLLRNPITNLRYRCWSDHAPLDVLEGKPQAAASSTPRQKRILPTRKKLSSSIVRSASEENSEPRLVVCSSRRNNSCSQTSSEPQDGVMNSRDDRRL